jgi:RES domain-containing protein
MGETVWYRIVGRKRIRPEEALPARSGRFHEDPHVEPTTYLGDSLMTVWRESQSARAGAARLDPSAFVGWRITLHDARLVDLREDKERTRWNVSEGELLGDPAPVKCREVARTIRRSGEGIHGILYRSLRHPPKGLCLALFLERKEVIATFNPVPRKEWDEFVRSLEKA